MGAPSIMDRHPPDKGPEQYAHVATIVGGEHAEIARLADRFLGLIAVHRHCDRELAAVPA